MHYYGPYCRIYLITIVLQVEGERKIGGRVYLIIRSSETAAGSLGKNKCKNPRKHFALRAVTQQYLRYIHLNAHNKLLCGRNKYLTTKSIDIPNKTRTHDIYRYIGQCKKIYFTPKIWFTASFPSVGIIVVSIMTYYRHHKIIISKAPIIYNAYCVYIIILSRNMRRGGTLASHGCGEDFEA